MIASLRDDISGLIAVNPEGGRVAHAQAISPHCESGNVYLPHPAIAPWVDGLVEELASFPNAAHDDQADAPHARAEFGCGPRRSEGCSSSGNGKRTN